MHGRSHADAPAFDAVLGRGLALLTFVRPVQGRCSLVNTFLQASAANVPAVHRGFAHFECIAFVHLHWIEIQLFGHGVDVAVEGEQHLRATKTTKRAAWRVVGVVQRGL